MCRYAMSPYKPHFACFDCRKTFKRRLLVDINRDDAYNKNYIEKDSKCPDCGQQMANMGLDFEAPKKTNVKAWHHLNLLFETGITFHSCGCSGPGFVPRNQTELVAHFSKIKSGYIDNFRFWSTRKESLTKQSDREKQLDWNKNGKFLSKIPADLNTGTRKNKTIDIGKAVQYWTHKIKEIDQYLATIKKQG